MILGMAQGLVSRDPREINNQRAKALRVIGVRTIVTHFTPPPDEMKRGLGRDVRAVLEAEGLTIAQASGYNPNFVQPDETRARDDFARLREAFEAAQTLGAQAVLSGCGSMHPTSFYGPDARNHTPEVRSRLIVRLKEAAGYAEATGVPLNMECHVLTTLDTPTNIREIVDEVDSEWVRVNFDPVNLVGSLSAYYDTASLIRSITEGLGDVLAPCAHIKDVKVQDTLPLHLAEVAPGEGNIDWAAFFDACHSLGGDSVPLVVEHMPNVARTLEAAEAAKRLAAEHGVLLAA